MAPLPRIATARRSFVRRLIVSTAAVAAVAAALTVAACGSSDDGDSGEQPAANEKLSGDVTIWTWTTPGNGLKAAIPGFKQAHPDVRVKVEDVGNPAIWDKITTGMAAGGEGLPDIMNIGIDYLSNYADKFPGSLENLSEFGADELADDFPSGVWESGTSDGEVIGIPYEVNPAGILYRKDLFRKAGVAPEAIETWDELIEAGVTIKERTGVPLFGLDKAATDLDLTNYWQFLSALQGEFYFNSEGQVSMSSEAGARSLSLLKKANDLGVIADVPGGFENSMRMASGDIPVAVLPAPSWLVAVIENEAPKMAGKWAARRSPAIEPGGDTAAVLGATYLSVNAKSENKQAAWEFIEYALGTMEGQEAMYEAAGLFPAYLPLLRSPEFEAPHKYYDGQKVNALFVDILSEDDDTMNYTSDYARALRAYQDAQTKVLQHGADPQAALDEAAQSVADATGREIAG